MKNRSLIVLSLAATLLWLAAVSNARLALAQSSAMKDAIEQPPSICTPASIVRR